MSPRAAIRDAIQTLTEGGVASPEHDAGELLAHVLGTSRSQLPLIETIDDPAAERFFALVQRRAARHPLQHLTGEAHFRHLTLAVGPGVFVPRPETELLAGWAISIVEHLKAPRVVDLCTGSGAIAASIATEMPHSSVYACELSPSAFAWAEQNLAGTGVEAVCEDMATAFTKLDGTVDVVTCNPPYIPLEAWESVATEARDHDPHLALFAGPDGLDAIRVLERRASHLLKPGGWLGVEHADAQSEVMPALFAATGRWTEIRDRVDLAGRPRFTTMKLADSSR